MKVTVLQVDKIPSKKDTSVNHSMTVLGHFSSYGVTRPATVQVKLDSTSYQKFQPLVGKELDIDFIYPLPDYPLQLA